MGAIAFAFQIYGDFSGYSDIALGTAKLFGFELLSNFKFPYFSRDIAEFWRRWHISLSSWFRDYLYIPLGGSRRGLLINIRNVFIIFLVSGFWHGANWTFIFWGALHAIGFLPLLLLNQNRKNLTSVVAENRSLPSLPELRQLIFTFTFVTFAWIFFRADSIQQAFHYLAHMFGDIIRNPRGNLAVTGKLSIVYILILLLIDWRFRRNERALNIGLKSVFLNRAFYVFLGLAILLYFGKTSSFIYFQF